MTGRSNGVIELPLAPVLDIADIKVYGDDDTPAIIDPAHYYEDKVSAARAHYLAGLAELGGAGARGQWH